MEMWIFLCNFSRRFSRQQLRTKHWRLPRKSVPKRRTMYWRCECISLQMLTELYRRILWRWHWWMPNKTICVPEWSYMQKHEWRLFMHLCKWMDWARLRWEYWWLRWCGLLQWRYMCRWCCKFLLSLYPWQNWFIVSFGWCLYIKSLPCWCHLWHQSCQRIVHLLMYSWIQGS